MSEKNPFAEQYGPWASIADASEGEGAALEPALAVRGVNVVLLAHGQVDPGRDRGRGPGDRSQRRRRRLDRAGH
jgi:hypothetical protein